MRQRLRAWLEDRAEQQPFTDAGERRRRWLHRLARLVKKSRRPSG
jgi:hypothetical protein